ncbi:MAG TPA: hypothetical protein VGJ28_14170 [Micromonosporaceae bacterium]|jgi:hypothetical protein
MATWQYGELMAESVSSADDDGWVTHMTLTWRGPAGEPRAVDGTSVYALNRLGIRGWELSGVTRTHLEDRFQIKMVTTYTLKRPVRRRSGGVDRVDFEPVPA